MNNDQTVDELIEELEAKGLGYSLDSTANGHREARVWKWPYVVGRYTAPKRESAWYMLKKAYDNVDWNHYAFNR